MNLTAALLRRVRPEQVRELGLVLVLVAMIAFFATQIPDYLSGRTFTRISTSVAVIAVMAVGQVLVVLTRNIDLSVGSIVGLVAYVVGTLLAGDPTMHPMVAVAISIAIGALAACAESARESAITRRSHTVATASAVRGGCRSICTSCS